MRVYHEGHQKIEKNLKKLKNRKDNPTFYTLLEVANVLEISLSKLVDLS